MQFTHAKLFIEMERIVTTLAQLVPGDRFYFKSDRRRITYEVMEPPEKKKTWKHGGHTWACDIQVKDDAGNRKYCLRKTAVVQLKSNFK